MKMGLLWFEDYKAVVALYPNLSRLQKVYFFLRFLVCPFSQIESFVPKKGLVIDVGCGYGIFSNLMALRSDKRQVWGCDIEEDRIEASGTAAMRQKNVSFSVATVKTLKLPKCDVVTMVDLLHHVHPELQESIIKESFSKLKDGGTLVIKDIDTKPFFKYAFNYVHDFVMTRGEPLYFAGQKGLSKQLERIGFDVTVHRLKTTAPYSHILLMCRKRAV